MRYLPVVRMRLLRRSLDDTIRAASRSDTAPEWEIVVDEIRRRVTRRCRRYDLPAAEGEEIEGDMLASLIATLRTNGPERIRRFDPYVDVLINNLCKARIRQRHPVWTRLKDEIVETLRGRRNARGFAMWRSQSEEVGGYAAWEGRAVSWTERYLEMHRDLTALQHHVRTLGPLRTVSVARLLDAVFSWCDTPLPLSELTSTLFKLRELREIEMQEIDTTIEALPGSAPAASHLVIAEIADAMGVALLDLSNLECAAFFLHQKSAVADRLLLPLARVHGEAAAMTSLAERLRIPLEKMERVLCEIPWSDLRIAEHLGLGEATAHRTQQRIINLRQQAIQRMQRRIENLEGATRDLSDRARHRTPAHGP